MSELQNSTDTPPAPPPAPPTRPEYERRPTISGDRLPRATDQPPPPTAEPVDGDATRGQQLPRTNEASQRPPESVATFGDRTPRTTDTATTDPRPPEVTTAPGGSTPRDTAAARSSVGATDAPDPVRSAPDAPDPTRASTTGGPAHDTPADQPTARGDATARRDSTNPSTSAHPEQVTTNPGDPAASPPVDNSTHPPTDSVRDQKPSDDTTPALDRHTPGAAAEPVTATSADLNPTTQAREDTTSDTTSKTSADPAESRQTTDPHQRPEAAEPTPPPVERTTPAPPAADSTDTAPAGTSPADTRDTEPATSGRTVTHDATGATPVGQQSTEHDPPEHTDPPSPTPTTDTPTPRADALRANRPDNIPPAVWNRICDGHEFNEQREPHYTARGGGNEINLDNGKRLDSYIPNREIVSRKHTQLADISQDTGIAYVREVDNKYRPGILIKDTPHNRAELPAEVGLPLDGRMILEVPPQTRPIPDAVLKEAEGRDVRIRDTDGTVYRRLPDQE